MTKLISRRAFLKGAGATMALAVLAGCQSPRRWVTLEPFVRPPEEQLAGEATWFASTCRQCPAGCGIVVRVMNGRALKLEGNPEHPLNRGTLCARGQAGLQLLYNPDRLSGPVQQTARGSHQFKALDWNTALNTLTAKVREAGQGIAVWGGSTISGHVYDLFRRITSASGAAAPLIFDLYTSVQGEAAFRQANQALFGRDDLPVYDLSHADVIFSFSADFLGAWLCQTRYGAEYGAFRGQPLGRRGYLLQLEPRMSITGVKADRWLPVRPGYEALFAQALVRLIAEQKLGTPARSSRAATLASTVDINAVAQANDLSAQELAQLARLFAEAENPIAIPGSTLSGQPNSTDAINAIQQLNIVAGGIGQPGGVTLSPAPALPNLVKPASSSYTDALKLIERMRAGEIKLLLVHGANPAYELPPRAGFVEALKNVPNVISFAPIVDETAAWADWIMPDRTYLESWGYNLVSSSFNQTIISSQQPVVTPVFDARSTGDLLLALAQRNTASAAAVPYTDEVAFLKETVNALGAGAAGGSGTEVLWARFLQHGGWWQAAPAVPPLPQPQATPITLSPPQFQGDEEQYPYLLHLYPSGLLTDASSANLPWLQGTPDPMTTIAWQTWIELNLVTAKQLGVQDGDLVQVTSPEGEIQAAVYTTPAIRPDTVAIPLGQGHTEGGRYARERGANALGLVGVQASASGGVSWSTLRVKLTPTGRRIDLAKMESTEGVREGFINAGFPGQ